jgi:hypothetical protein
MLPKVSGETFTFESGRRLRKGTAQFLDDQRARVEQRMKARSGEKTKDYHARPNQIGRTLQGYVDC